MQEELYPDIFLEWPDAYETAPTNPMRMRHKLKQRVTDMETAMEDMVVDYLALRIIANPDSDPFHLLTEVLGGLTNALTAVKLKTCLIKKDEDYGRKIVDRASLVRAIVGSDMVNK